MGEESEGKRQGRVTKEGERRGEMGKGDGERVEKERREETWKERRE